MHAAAVAVDGLVGGDGATVEEQVRSAAQIHAAAVPRGLVALDAAAVNPDAVAAAGMDAACAVFAVAAGDLAAADAVADGQLRVTSHVDDAAPSFLFGKPARERVTVEVELDAAILRKLPVRIERDVAPKRDVAVGGAQKLCRRVHRFGMSALGHDESCAQRQRRRSKQQTGKHTQALHTRITCSYAGFRAVVGKRCAAHRGPSFETILQDTKILAYRTYQNRFKTSRLASSCKRTITDGLMQGSFVKTGAAMLVLHCGTQRSLRYSP